MSHDPTAALPAGPPHLSDPDFPQREVEFRTLTEAAPVGIFLTTAEGDIRFVNETWCRLTGISAEDAQGNGWERAIHPDDLPRVKADWIRSVEGGQPSVSEFRFRRPDGSVSWVLGHAVPQKDPLGGLIGYVGSCVDVTERHQSQVLMSAQKGVLEQIANHTPLSEVLTAIARLVEEQCPGAYAEILLPDTGSQQLSRAAAPRLPADVELQSVALSSVDAKGGWKETSIATNDLDLKSGWNMAIRSGQGEIFGMLAIYFRERRVPTPRENHVSEVLAGLAALAILRLASITRINILTEESNRRMRLYEGVLSNTPDLAYVFDLEHRFTYANTALLKMWGMSAQEAFGKTCLEIGYEPWHAAMHDREIEEVILTKSPIRGDVPFNSAEKGRRIYDYIFSPILGANGEVEAIAGTTRDVTERKQAEQRASFLSDLTTTLATISDPDEIMRVAADALREKVDCHRCYFLECDEAEARITVRNVALREGATPIDGTYPLYDFGGIQWWREYTSGDFQIDDIRRSPHTEYRQQPYLDLCVLSYAVQPFRSEGSTSVALAITEDQSRHWSGDEMELLDDIISRVWPMVQNARAMAELSASRQQLRLLWETAGIILAADEPRKMLEGIFDKLRHHLHIDAYFNFMVDEAGQALVIKFCQGIEDRFLPKIQRIEFGQAVCGNVARYREAIVAPFVQTSGDPRVNLVKGMGITSYASYPLLAGGELLGTISFASRSREEFTEAELEFMQTISHHVTGAYARLKLVESLRESDRKKDQFLATLAHELRNPLAPILTGLDVMLARPEDGAKVWEVAGMMQRQVGQMVHLIDDLLDMSRVTTGKIVLKKSQIALTEIIQSALEASAPLIQQYKHDFQVNQADPSIHLDADPHRIAQVISNLLSNAAKYTPPGGRISLEVTPDGEDSVLIAVRDNGFGIKPADQSRIFKLFEQDDHGRNDGLGIGLTLVRSLVELHGGTITVRSDGPMLGSEFSVRLPATRVEAASDPVPTMTTSPPPAKTRKVLVADDGKSAADVLGMFFQMEGMEVVVTYDGQEAVEAAETFEPDMVFMDLGMPRMDGFEAARRISARFPNAKLVALSGWGRDEDRIKSAEAGFTEHLIKPVSPQDLRSALSRLGA